MAFRIHRGLWQFQKADGNYESKYKINDSGVIVQTDASGNEVAGLAASSVSWSSITGVPSTFSPSAHTHDDRYFTESEADSRFLIRNSWNGNLYFNNDGRIHSTIMYDANDSNYYVDPSGTSHLNDLRINIIYDRNNTGYYLDPASTSNLNTVYTNTGYTTNVRGDYYFQQSHGNPRNNLGDPTVTEMALFNEQFNNKTSFYEPSRVSIWVQNNDGEEWQDITGNYSETEIRKFIAGYDTTGNIYIPNLAYKFRIELDARNYVFANSVYFYWSSNSHSTKLHLWARRCDNATWYQITSSNNNVSSWPGHLYMPHGGIAWRENNTTSSGHYSRLRYEFTPNWSGHATYGTQHIYLNKMQVWGGYPAGTRYPYTVNEYGDFTAIRNITGDIVYATGGNSTNWNTAYGWGNHGSAGYATTSYVTTQINNLINGAPGVLNTLDELAAALGDDANFASNVTNSIAAKLPLSGGTMSGNLVLKSISGTDQTVENTYGAYLHLGAWATGRTASDAVLVNTAYRADYADALFNMNISRFTNDSGYLTSVPAQSWASITGKPTNLSSFTNDLGNYGGWLTTSGKAADSNLLDGINSTSFLRSDANDSYNGDLEVNGMIFKDGSNANRNFKMQSNDAVGTDTGISIFNAAGAHTIQLYGTTSQYGFLDGNWAGWDIRKTKNGAFEVDEGSGLKRVWNEGIFANNSANWNTAYGWGNHASAGYLTSVPAQTWASITGKPSTFSPSAHTHAISEVTGLQSALDGKQAAGSYAPASHTHAYVPTNGSTWSPHASSTREAGWNIFYTNYGYIQFGPANSSWAHIYSDKSFYFNQDLYVNAAKMATESYVTSRGYLTTSGKAADSNLIDGIDSSRLLYGDNSHKSTSSGSMVGTSQQSGIYYGYSPTGAPYGEWWNWVTFAGASWTSGNNYDFKLAHDFHSDKFYVSRMVNGSQQSWREVVTSGNIGSQSVNYATTAGTANAVAWGNVSGKPGTFAPSAHTHDDRYYTESESDTRFATAAQGAKADTALQSLPAHNHDGVYLPVGGKAADANLLDGLDLHTGRNNQANKVVRTDGSGYIQAGWINTPSGATTSTVTKIFASADDYLRYVTPAEFRRQITDGVYQPVGSYAASSHSHTFSSITSKPTTLSGYGITDAATSGQGSKADSAYGWNPIVSATVSNDTTTYTKADGTTFALTTSDANTNKYLSGASFSTSTGVLTLTVASGTTITVDLDGRYLESLPTHDHSISEVRDLQAALNAKQAAGSYAAASHTHTPSQVGLGNVSNAAQVTTSYNSSLNSDSRNSRGVTRMYRRDSDSDYSVQNHWTGSYWYMRGYSGDNFHAEVQVGYANSAGSASSASSATSATTATNVDNGNTYTTGNNLYIKNSGVNNYRVHHNGSNGVFDVTNRFSIRDMSTIWSAAQFESGSWMSYAWFDIDPWGDNWGVGSRPTSWKTVNRGTFLTFGFEDWSDRRSKSAIVEIDNAVDKVKAIGGYTYWKVGSEVREGGVIAQDVLEVFPEAVGGSEEGYSIKPAALIGLLSKAIKEQQEMIDSLTARIELLENK